MYTLTTLIYFLANSAVKLMDILFNPSIGSDDEAIRFFNAPHNQYLMAGSSHDFNINLLFKEVCDSLLKKKQWLIFVVKEHQQADASNLINRLKTTRHQIVSIKSNEAKWWATEQALASQHCAAVVIFDSQFDSHNEKYQQLAQAFTASRLIVITDPIQENPKMIFKKAA
ncbi:MAG: hypothetical protein B7Z60_02465 [Ferrovum sp. 37-45-19]|jgi:hypothetical protein|nr:MAG: hypothetical protein B7Z65_01970 [Ferrovum sp. 21-44-67]OYV95073.1 MAG: hypothetical protein B7Z60_02465 [Ferrovum sp. 37-45-19]OZB31797.1 MAG: hypothetical protein B7X47_08350 [Ferrovum sp. 34-44-207]HQT80866.1 hypothetical protein [Ferrovaceae bacterium]HQU06606.1 hypothetical protein [Ferrovaceae bacterium]